MPRSDRREFFAPNRLLAFSDGVFAVAITLLVLDLRLPESEHGDAAMLGALRLMAPKLFIFAFTFVTSAALARTPSKVQLCATGGWRVAVVESGVSADRPLGAAHILAADRLTRTRDRADQQIG